MYIRSAIYFLIKQVNPMKKLKLRALELGATEILTREQLKKVLGGSGSGTGSGGSGGLGCPVDECDAGHPCRTPLSCGSVLCPDGVHYYHACGSVK